MAQKKCMYCDDGWDTHCEMCGRETAKGRKMNYPTMDTFLKTHVKLIDGTYRKKLKNKSTYQEQVDMFGY